MILLCITEKIEICFFYLFFLININAFLLLFAGKQSKYFYEMGNTISEELEPNDTWWKEHQSLPNQNVPIPSSSKVSAPNISKSTDSEITEIQINATVNENTETLPNSSTDAERRRRINEEKMEQFKSELANKHLARRQAIAERSREILFLREELAKHKKENEELKEALNKKNPEPEDTSWNEELQKLREENERLKNTVQEKDEELDNYKEITQQNHELRLNIAEVQKELQSVNAQVVSFENERHDYQTHVSALKEVVKVSKQLLEIRELQLEEVSHSNFIMRQLLNQNTATELNRIVA